MENNSTYSGSCPHCGCPVTGLHYEGCKRNEITQATIGKLQTGYEADIENIKEILSLLLGKLRAEASASNIMDSSINYDFIFYNNLIKKLNN
jgi:Rieske Fe-S protein